MTDAAHSSHYRTSETLQKLPLLIVVTAALAWDMVTWGQFIILSTEFWFTGVQHRQKSFTKLWYEVGVWLTAKNPPVLSSHLYPF